MHRFVIDAVKIIKITKYSLLFERFGSFIAI